MRGPGSGSWKWQPPRGRYVFIVDNTSVSHQGLHTENTFSTGNYHRRPAKVRRYTRRPRARRGCQSFVWGLLITPDGRRLSSFRSYYTRDMPASRSAAPHPSGLGGGVGA